MTKVTVTKDIRERLGGLTNEIELCDESGQTIGVFHPIEFRNPVDGSPFTDEEIRERSQATTGRSLREILQSLEKA